MRRTIITFALAAMLALSTMAAAIAGGTIGNNNDPSDYRDSAWSNWSIVDDTGPATDTGTIEEIEYHALAANPLRFFLVDENMEVTWVSDLFTPVVGSGTYVLPAPVGVAPGYRIGMFFGADGGSISFDTASGQALSQGEFSGLPVVGNTLGITSSPQRTYSVIADIIPAAQPTKDACKDGGWEEFTAAPGPFRNQGQCVSHFARTK